MPAEPSDRPTRRRARRIGYAGDPERARGAGGWNRGLELTGQPLEPAAIRAMIAASTRRSSTGLRNRALIAVLWRCGLRTSEALELERRDVDADAGTVRVRVALKRGRPRVVGCDALTLELLEAWWSRRQALGIPRRARFFCTLHGTPLQQREVRRIVALLGQRAGLEGRVHPHALRHSFAAELVREGVALPTLRDALGHGNVRTTDAYVRGLIGDAAVVDAMRSRSWEGPVG